VIAAHLDRQHLPGGSVLMDSFVGWGVWLASDDTKQFVITYILMRNPEGSDAPDAITKRYPTLWDDGAGFGTLVQSAAGPFGEERWRIYRVDRPTGPIQ